MVNGSVLFVGLFKGFCVDWGNYEFLDVNVGIGVGIIVEDVYYWNG